MQSNGIERLPRIAIVGRPNVGKSTLLNRMCGSRVSIVEPTAGVTRDRIAVSARLSCSQGERWFEVVDTGGIGIVDRHDLGPQIEEQVRVAVVTADLVLFVVDVREGVTPLDQEVARRLRGRAVPVLLVVNKTEGRALEWDTSQFLRLGMGEEVWPISAQNGDGTSELYERIVELLPGAPAEKSTRLPVLKLAVVGRRNSGKSTLINTLAGEERMIVSEVPGTTRDSVDVHFERDGETFIAIDTAGLRKKKQLDDAIEFFSEARAMRTVRRADVVLLLFDVTQKISGIEKQLARYAIDHYKPVILGANKWDLVPDLGPDDFRSYIEKELTGLAFAPIAFLSGKRRMNVFETLRLARDLHAQAHHRVTTGELNRVLEAALEARSPSSQGHKVRLYYATQAEIAPPTFVLFVNDKRFVGKDYLRYLTNRLREHLPFEEVPLRLVLRERGEERDDHSSARGDRS